jgi:hypothetical protein
VAPQLQRNCRGGGGGGGLDTGHKGSLLGGVSTISSAISALSPSESREPATVDTGWLLVSKSQFAIEPT